MRALTALAGGATVTAAAEAAGRDRTTIHRWLRSDPLFQAAYNASRADLKREVEAHLDHLVQEAVDAVSTAVRAGDVRAALAILKGTGVLAGAPLAIGSDHPRELAEEDELARRERAASRTMRDLVAF